MHASAALSRRELLRTLGALAAAATVVPGCSDSEAVNPVPGAFLSDVEMAAIAALADHVLPPDDLPGGGALGAAPFILKMLTALDGAEQLWFAGGPYSGRAPFGDGKGGASKDFPEDSFSTFVPLDRVTERAVRLFLFGSKGTDGGGPNDHVAGAGPIVGLRDLVKEQIGIAIKSSVKPLSSLDAEGLRETFAALDRPFQATFIELVCEAAFSAPEYGGNVDQAGWKLCHFPGDPQPLGYSLYDAATDSYRESADAPMTKLDPGPDPEPMSAEVRSLIESIAKLQGGTVFK